MNEEIRKQIDEYWNKKEHEKIVELIMSVPKPKRDIEMLGQLVVAYNNLKKYEEAVKLSLEMKEESGDIVSWYYRIGYAMIKMSDFEGAAIHLKNGMELAKRKKDKKMIPHIKSLYNRCVPYLYEKGIEEWKEEPLEIVWSEEEKEYVAVAGSIELGYFGKFRTDQIEIDFSEYDFCEEIEEFVSEEMTNDEIAKGLTKYFNVRLADIKKHIIQINQAFLAYVLDDMNGCGYPFWEDCKSYVVWEKMPDTKDSDIIYKSIYTKELDVKAAELFDRYYETAANKEVDNTLYVEEFMDEMLPMFDYKKMLKDIYSEYLYMKVDGISVQCSGEKEALALVCAACVSIENDNSFYDWHNH